ncbi:MAG: GatB/YqeY domain-containing protein [Anaerolineales bacterium]|nr:GatB/YqeY domain-containing protein [Anaerolineales bacterium]
MNTKNKLSQSLKDALKSGDIIKKNTIRLALSAIKNAEIEKKRALEESEVLAILQKEVKSRHETIEGAKQAKRPDLIDEAQAEITILEEYLPRPFTQEELEKIVKEVITEVGASSPREMGQVMKILMPRVQGRADGKQVSQMVRQFLGE